MLRPRQLYRHHPETNKCEKRIGCSKMLMARLNTTCDMSLQAIARLAALAWSAPYCLILSITEA